MTSYCSLLYLAVFLPAVVLVHRILPQRLRWAALLAASYAFFWSVSGKLLVFLLVSTVSIHYFGLWLASSSNAATITLPPLRHLTARPSAIASHAGCAASCCWPSRHRSASC